MHLLWGVPGRIGSLSPTKIRFLDWIFPTEGILPILGCNCKSSSASYFSKDKRACRFQGHSGLCKNRSIRHLLFSLAGKTQVRMGDPETAGGHCSAEEILSVRVLRCPVRIRLRFTWEALKLWNSRTLAIKGGFSISIPRSRTKKVG